MKRKHQNNTICVLQGLRDACFRDTSQKSVYKDNIVNYNYLI